MTYVCSVVTYIIILYVFQEGSSSKTCHIVQKIFLVLTEAIMYQTYVGSTVTYIIILYVFQEGNSKNMSYISKDLLYINRSYHIPRLLLECL